MGEIVRFRRPSAAEKHRGKTLCRSGFHRWEALDTPFDTRRGKLVTHYRCRRCGALRSDAK